MNKYKFDWLGLALFIINLLLFAALMHLMMKAITNKDDLTKYDWSTDVYNQCIISEPKEIASIKIQDSFENLGRQRVTYYDFNKIAYPARLNINFLTGVVVIAKLNNNKDVYLNIDYGNHTCELSMYDNSSTDFKQIYDKSGYLGSSIDNKDIDDFFYKLHKEHDLNIKKN